MIELLSTLTFSQILIYGVLFAVAAKEFLSVKDFFEKRNKDKNTEENNEKKQTEQILNAIKDLEKVMLKQEKEDEQIHKEIKKLSDYWQNKEDEHRRVLQLLIDSDKDAIKSFIVKEHHHFVAQKWIDDFSLDTIEKRYSHYKAEGGNSYIGDLIQDLRALPNFPPSTHNS